MISRDEQAARHGLVVARVSAWIVWPISFQRLVEILAVCQAEAL